MKNINIWEGVYQNFSDCPLSGKGFDGDLWVSKSVEEVKSFMSSISDNNVILKRNRDNYLPFLISSLSSQISGDVNILDFGGGLGFTYAATLKKNCAQKKFKFSIVETSAVCNAGNVVFQNDDNIQFYDSLTKVEKTDFHIVHFGSCLQYIEDWRELILQVSSLKPNYILFTGVLAGDIPDFVSVQNYYDSKIPVWFLNLNSLTSFIESGSYSLAFKSDYYPTYFGIEQDMPMDNFPENMRLKRPINLLFVRKNSEL